MDPIPLASPEEWKLMRNPRDQRAAHKATGNRRDSSSRKSNITRQHWREDRDHATCTRCHEAFTLCWRRSHCRRCGFVFCRSCTGYKLHLNEKAEYDPNAGALHKVCFRCAKEKEQIVGQTRSHAEDFLFDRKQSLLKYEHPEVYNKLLERFNIDLHRKQARLRRAFKKVKLATPCATVECNRRMLLPKNRKKCVTCAAVFCRECTPKDAVVFLPLDDPKREPRISIAQTVTVTAQLPKNRRTYRVCLECRESLHQHFNRNLDLCQSKLLKLQAQISPAIDRLQNEDILKKQFEQYYHELQSLKAMKPTSDKQENLHKKVTQATAEYYNTKIVPFRKRFGW